MRKTYVLGLPVLALAVTGWVATASAQQAPAAPDQSAAPAAPDQSAAPAAPDQSAAPAAGGDTGAAPAPAPKKHHAMKRSGHHKMAKDHKLHGDAAVADLNAQSLAAAKSGKPFTPGANSTEAPASGTSAGGSSSGGMSSGSTGSAAPK